jgi:hypothetical protein
MPNRRLLIGQPTASANTHPSETPNNKRETPERKSMRRTGHGPVPRAMRIPILWMRWLAA